MYIVNVIPLIKIPFPNPQILSYFFDKKLKKGALVKISIKKKQINALVVSSERLENKKIEIKKSATFKLKPIEKIISANPVLTNKQIDFIIWFSRYYFYPLGPITKLFLPKNLITRKRPISEYQIPYTFTKKLILTPENKRLIFLPYKNLKHISIKKAESSKFVSWGRKPYYDARTLAFYLAKQFKAKIELNATSFVSVDFYYLAKRKNYKISIQQPGNKVKKTKLIDMRQEIKEGNFSIISRDLKSALEKYKKAILYIPRRGDSTFIFCRDCGYVLKCSQCEVPLVLHKRENKLICHYCNNEEKPPALCPNCKSYRIKYYGAGTQKVESEIKKILPKIKIFRLDSDVIKNPASQKKVINQFNREKTAILIGTQMIFEKNIRPVELVAVASIETILNLPDYRSSERVFEILSRLKKMSNNLFFVQTYNPENFAINCALKNNWKKFYQQEIKLRKTLNYPPFSQLIKLVFEHKELKRVKTETEILLKKLEFQASKLNLLKEKKVQFLGPSPCFVPKIRKKYRWQIVIKSNIKELGLRNQLLMTIPSNWHIEIDPESLL